MLVGGLSAGLRRPSGADVALAQCILAIWAALLTEGHSQQQQQQQQHASGSLLSHHEQQQHLQQRQHQQDAVAVALGQQHTNFMNTVATEQRIHQQQQQQSPQQQLQQAIQHQQQQQQQQQQLQAAAAAVAAATHAQQQQVPPQQQQQQQAATATVKPPAPKSNHRLVSKIKDARHRRRHRHHRHRHRHQQIAQHLSNKLGEKSAPALANVANTAAAAAAAAAATAAAAAAAASDPLAVAPIATLTALESIVEEVAQAGQSQHQHTTASSSSSSSSPSASSSSSLSSQASAPSPSTAVASSSSSSSSSPSPSSALPVSSNQQQHLQQQQHQFKHDNGNNNQSPQVQSTPQQHVGSSAPNPTDLLLVADGSSSVSSTMTHATSPATSLLAAAAAVSSTLATTSPVNQQPPLHTQLTTAPPHGRHPPNNSRGSFFLTTMLSKIMNVLNVTEFALEMREGISSRASCMACNAVVGLFLSPLYSKEVFSAAIRTVCTSFKIQTPRVCTGLVESFQDDFEFIRKNTKLTRDEICAVVFGVDCARRQTANLFWTVQIPDFSLLPGVVMTRPNAGNNPPVMDPSTSGLDAQTNIKGQLGTMDDAPDLFEYRKSTTSPGQTSASMKQQRQRANSDAAAAAQGDNAPSTLEARSSQQKAQVSQQPANNNNNKQAKMLKRPEYIFDDEHLVTASNSEDGAVVAGNLPRSDSKQVSSFIQITDIHIDPYYEPGSLNECSEPLCCRLTSGPMSLDKRRQAGRWGDYGNCDTPVRTLRSALKRIRDQHPNAEYWLWTGDISPHDIWNISKPEAANNVRLVTKMIREYSNGVPVFPVIGNHEAHPVNSFAPPEIKGKFSMSWLYDLLADEWSDWLPKDALKTLRTGGYYKLQVRRGFRIIVLNTNYCARLNPWSFYDPVDPGSQLKWLVEELLEAELNQDRVHIVSHVPPDNRECTQAWLFNFINIVDRFRDTIAGQFYGHTHRDEFRVMYSLKRPDDPIGVQYIGPSLTPFTENNPAYRIYHQDKGGNLIAAETYYFNLTEANEAPADAEPHWRYAYDTRSHLNMSVGLNPQEWHNYLSRLHEDEELFDTFYKNFYRSSDVKMNQVCKAKCRYQMLSDLRLSHPYKTKPKPFLANRKTSNHHRDRYADNHHNHHHHKRLRHSD